MAKMLSLSIDVTKLDKSRFFHGKKGVYADITIAVNDESNEYGKDVSAWQGQTAEEREAKADRNFIGAGKVFWSSDGPSANNQAKANGYQPEPMGSSPADDTIPF